MDVKDAAKILADCYSGDDPISVKLPDGKWHETEPSSLACTDLEWEDAKKVRVKYYGTSKKDGKTRLINGTLSGMVKDRQRLMDKDRKKRKKQSAALVELRELRENFKRAMSLAGRYRAEARRHRRTIRSLVRDIEDMRESRCTSFVRCPNPKCRHLHDSGYICPDCGWDHTCPPNEQSYLK